MKPLLMMFVFALLEASAFATVRYVSKDGTGNFTTIQAAINAAVAGDTIVIRGDQGRWNEGPIVDRRLTIMGQGSGCSNVAATEMGGGFTFNFGSGNSVIAGLYFNLINSGGSTASLSGNVQGISIRRCRISTAGSWITLNLNIGSSIQVQESSIITASDPSTRVAELAVNASLTLVNCVISQVGGGQGGSIASSGADNIFLTNCPDC